MSKSPTIHESHQSLSVAKKSLNSQTPLEPKPFLNKVLKTSRYSVEIVIPAWNEPHTVSKLIRHITNEVYQYKIPIKNVWLVTHDKKTGKAGLQADTLGIVQHILVPQEKGGKNASLNTAIKKLSADYIIFIDGDITLKGKHPLLDLVQDMHYLTTTKPQKHINVGAIAGRPAALDSAQIMLGFWAHTLTHAAHKLRLICQMNRVPINISGNLYIVKKEALPPEIPLSVIDDAFMSLWIQKQGYSIIYQPKALAYQQYPKTYRDWLIQKLRNLAGEKLTLSYFKKHYPEFYPRNMRTFTQEIRYFMFTLERARSLKHLWWLFLLYLARIHLWLLYFYKIYIRKESPQNVWENWKKVG